MPVSLDDRRKEYGQAWLWSGYVIGVLGKDFTQFVSSHPWCVFPWLMIMNKLMRALVNPFNKDHWDDIIGYAQLVLNHMEANDGLSSE